MKIAVWDTYVQRMDGKVMHFDILVSDAHKDAEQIYKWGKEYLNTKTIESGELTSKECTFCHIEKATEQVEKEINSRGYSILEMQNCN